jgi:hypothetical protein
MMHNRLLPLFAVLLLATQAGRAAASGEKLLIEGRIQRTPAAGAGGRKEVQVIYEVIERPPARVGRIVLMGNERRRLQLSGWPAIDPATMSPFPVVKGSDESVFQFFIGFHR